MENNLVGATDILAHVTPEVMANHLPASLVSELLSKSLAAGEMTPEQVVETLTPELLADHIPAHILWACVHSAAEAAGLTGAA